MDEDAYMGWELFLLGTISCISISICPRLFAFSAVALIGSGRHVVCALHRNDVS